MIYIPYRTKLKLELIASWVICIFMGIGIGHLFDNVLRMGYELVKHSFTFTR